jgi:hypothetical protein
VEIGSARWQPVFLSGIALVLGVQALLGGAILANASPVAPTSQRRFAFVDNPRLPNRALALGLVAILCGLAIDVALFLAWWTNTSSAPTTGVAFGFASLAQILLILGGTLALSGIIARFVRRNGGHAEPASSKPAAAVDKVDRGA